MGIKIKGDFSCFHYISSADCMKVKNSKFLILQILFLGTIFVDFFVFGLSTSFRHSVRLKRTKSMFYGSGYISRRIFRG